MKDPFTINNADLSQCPDCGAHFQVDPRGDIQSGPCPECGGTRMFMDQPSPVQSDGTLRNMVDSDTQKDAGGNPLKEGTIMGEDGERSLDHRDNYMHGHVIAAIFETPEEQEQREAEEAAGHVHVAPEIVNLHDHPDTWRTPSPFEPPKKPGLIQRMFEANLVITSGVCPACGKSTTVYPNGASACNSYLCGKHWGPDGQEVDHKVPPATEPPGPVKGATPYLDIDKISAVDVYTQPNSQEGEGDSQKARLWDRIDKLRDQGEVSGLLPKQNFDKPAWEPTLFQTPQIPRCRGCKKPIADWGAAAQDGVYECPGCSQLSMVTKIRHQGASNPSVIDRKMTDFERHSRSMEPYESLWEREGGLVNEEEAAGNPQPGEAQPQQQQGGGGGGGLPVPGVGGLMKGVMGGGGEAGAGAAGLGEVAELAPLALLAFVDQSHYETPASNPDVGTKHDDPEEVDQKEFNDGDKSPKNIKNPETGEPGGVTLGEKGHNKADDSMGMDNFDDHSPASETFQQLLPLLLHFFNSEESGANHPAIKGLHEMLEQEHPGYLDKGDPHHAEILIQTLQAPKHAGAPSVWEETGQQVPCSTCQASGNPNCPMCQGRGTMPERRSIVSPDEIDRAAEILRGGDRRQAVVENPGMAGEAPEMVGGGAPEAKPFAGMQPGGMAEPGIGGGCPSCGGALDGAGGCPQCGTGQGNTQTQQMSPLPGGSAFAQQALQTPQNPQMRAANHQGPVTPEQISVIQTWLMEHGRQEEVPNVPLDPGNPEYVKILSEIQGRANVAPQVQPQEVTPPPPPPSPGGSMPVPGMGAGEAGGQPMSPVSSVNEDFPDDALFFDKISGNWSNGYEAPMKPSLFDEKAGLGAPPAEEERYITAPDGRVIDTWAHNNVSAPEALTQDDQWWQDHDLWAGHTAADNVAERCPQCGSATTGMVGDQDGTQHCHSCGNNWRKSDEIDDAGIGSSTLSHTAAPTIQAPNPVDAPAAEQASPLDIQPNEDSGLTWKDESGQPLEAGQTYMMKSTQYPVPDMVKIMRVKPDGLEVNEIGTFGNDPNALHHTIHVTREEMQANELTFQVAPQDADDRNNEPPVGGQAPGMPPVQETTDQRSDADQSFRASVQEQDDRCPKCGHADGDLTSKGHRISHSSTMVSEDQVEHECSYCGENWITKEEMVEGLHATAGENGERTWANPAADWLNEDEDSWGEVDRQRMLAAASHRSRNIGDIPRDRHAQEVKAYLDSQPSIVKEGGRYFSPMEQRGLIDEDGVARNSDMLNLDGTHYKHSREETTVDPDRVPLEHILFGL